MLESLAGALSAVRRTGPTVLLGVAIGTGVTLVAPDSLLSSLGLAEIIERYRPQVAISFIGSVSLLTAHGLAATLRFAQDLYRKKRKRRAAAIVLQRKRKRLHSLTADEKAYLAPFVLNGKNTLYFKIEDGVAGGLVQERILYRPSSAGRALTGFAHNIQPWAREYLEENPKLLKGANPRPSGPPSW